LKLLYVTEEIPNRDAAQGNGSSMIPYEVIRHLPADVTVTLVTYDGDLDLPVSVRDRCEEVVQLPKRGPAAAAALSLLGPLSPGAAALATPTARGTVRRLSRQNEVTLLHGPHVASLAHSVTGPLVLQVVDPWSARVAMEVALARGLRARYRTVKARQSLALERSLPARAQLLTVGEADAVAWSARLGRPVVSIGNGVDVVPQRWSPPPQPVISFVGSLGYQPNVESAEILVRDIAPRIWQEVPSARIIIAGRQPTPAVLALASNRVEVRANVPSVADVYLASSVAVFADRHGLGVRNSVREALACGLPVVASVEAAREQPPHALLKVARDEDELVSLAVAALTAAPADPAVMSGPGGPGPSWSEVSAAYMRVCREAVSALHGA
jgi:glycosyltransferase involved in cell wall biosynthesis